MRDNDCTSPDIIALRYRAGDNQATINIELGLINVENLSQSDGLSGGSSSAVGGLSTVSAVVSGGGTGNPPCFIGETLISLPDGSQITFEQAYKDRLTQVLSFNTDGNKVVGKVLSIRRTLVYEYANVTFSDGVSGVIPEHRYYVGGDYISIKHLIGQSVFNENDNAVDVLSMGLVQVPDGVYVYNFSIKGYENYVADRKRVHNNKRLDPDGE